MTNNEKEYRIYVRSANQWVPCTKEQFDDYYRDINAYRRTQMNHGRCFCPPPKRFMCDMDCWNCPYRAAGDIKSLDAGRIDDAGDEMNWLDHLQEEIPELQTPSNDDIVTDAMYLRQILNRLNEVMPQAIEIGRLREKGFTDTAIAIEIGTPRKTFTYRIKNAMKILKSEFPEFF